MSDLPQDTLVNLLLRQAIQSRASHLLVTAEDGQAHIRYRVHHQLRRFLVLPLPLLDVLDAAFQARAGDGRSHFWEQDEGQKYRFDLSRAESELVLRARPVAALRELPDLGLSERLIDPLRALMQRRQGLILISGPSESGRSTLLAALLRCAQRKAALLDPDWHTSVAGVKQLRSSQPLTDQLASVRRQNFEVVGLAHPLEMDALQELARQRLVVAVVGPEAPGGGAVARINVRMVPALCSCKLEHDGECLRNGCQECGFQGVAGSLPLAELFVGRRRLSSFAEEAGKLVHAGLVERQVWQDVLLQTALSDRVAELAPAKELLAS